jgi:invasion protein IalB
MRSLDLHLAFALALLLASGPSQAQQSTSATYSDWVVRCQKDAGAGKKTCVMDQVTQVKGKNQAFSRTALAAPVSGRPINLEVQLPVNVSLRAPVVLRTDDADPGFSAPFDRCVPAGCFAEFDVKDEIVKKLRAAEGVGKATFKDSSGHDIAVPVSFKGFREAFDALAKSEE